MTSKIECANDYFSCKVKNGIAVVRLCEKAFEIVTELAPSKMYISLIEAIKQDSDVAGLVQINDLNFRDDLVNQEFLESMRGEKLDKFKQLSTLMTRYGNIAGRLSSVFSAFTKPMVAGIDGNTTLEYFAIVLPFDYRIATHSSNAVFPNIRNGFPPSGNLVYQLQRAVGAARAAEIFLVGEPLVPSRLLEYGLISKIGETDHLEEQCLAVARKICDQPSIALMATRQMLRPAESDFQKFMEKIQGISQLVLAKHLQQ
jgi:enoyl-CoA hydratase/carnithine racemase